jgi:hypothetical protein
LSEPTDELIARLQIAIAPGARDRLLDRGLARGLIWRDGALPEGAPQFSETLSDDLLDYGHTIMAMALRLRSSSPMEPLLERAFLVAGEAIEAAVHRGQTRIDRGFHRVTAAVAFHLARYAARAYSMLPIGSNADNLAPAEEALVYLLRRRLDDLHNSFSGWLLDSEHSDDSVAAKLQDNTDFDENDAIHDVLTSSFMRGLALFDHAITTGMAESAEMAKSRFITTADAARELHAVNHWWTSTMAAHLIDDLWRFSLHMQIPLLPPEDDDRLRWFNLRRSYIQCLRAGKRAAIELWPSQLQAARRSLNSSDDLVVALPTSAGKTRIAELCILRTLASKKRVIYVTPLRALSAQVERDLAESLQPLGFSVSSLYGSAGNASDDKETLRGGRVVVSTPEKLDFALRSDPSIIDEVGLIVLDEGHMLGPNEREVRYEALVQRLVRRGDADDRRIVCLSALFPTPGEMSELVAWIRMGEPGDPVHSTWRPTRQRFGVLRWASDAARLDVKLEEESPFIPRFIEARSPPEGSRRRKLFPAEKNELTLATAWLFVEQQKEVLVYCTTRKSVETLGRLALKAIEQGVLLPIRPSNSRIKDTMRTGAEWLGSQHPAVACLEHGIALHHGGLPRPFLTEVERLLRAGDCPITIASPTLAQGLNLSASVLLVPSLWRNKGIIPTAEFANVVGRAGRAFVDVEGIVLNIVWGETTRKGNQAVRDWWKLVADAKAPQVVSGILQLAATICQRISKTTGISFAEILDYVTGHSDAWSFSVGSTKAAREVAVTAAEWDRDVASLDTAILALLDGETADDRLEIALDNALEGSLFSRQLEQKEPTVQQLLRGFVTARARQIWSQTQPAQRRGYYAAGVGLAAGKFIDANLTSLMRFLGQAEGAISAGEPESAAIAILAFAELVFQVQPFGAPKELPVNWKEALSAWMCGQPSSEVIRICGDTGVDLVQEVIAYRLPWAMEAVRVHALATGHGDAETLTGIAALAVEAGSANISIITLVRAGLSSREAATAAVNSTNASFTERSGMRAWLESEELQTMSSDPDWPTVPSRHAWLQFYEGGSKANNRKWSRYIQKIRVTWGGVPPAQGTDVIVEPSQRENGVVMTPDFQYLGDLDSPMRSSRSDVVAARVGDGCRTVDVEYFGPIES